MLMELAMQTLFVILCLQFLLSVEQTSVYLEAILMALQKLIIETKSGGLEC